jgi:hypothetical protein
LLFASGAISWVFAARHNVLMLNRKTVIAMGLAAMVAAIVAFILGRTNAM